MKWPFRAKRPHADVRVFRHPKTGELTLRLDGKVGLPTSWEEPVLVVDVRLEAPLSNDAATGLRDELNHLLPSSKQED
jgi:hypothetical protein